MNFYVAITTIRKYKIALDILIESLPREWSNRYILIYQDESENSYKIFEDGHIEVYITNNLSDYGAWIGINILFEKGVVPDDSWFLFIHDTCKFVNNNCVNLTNRIIMTYNNTDTDIVWLCKNGQCNICLTRKKAILYGNNIYKNIPHMSKKETIEYEWRHNNVLSPKSFVVGQKFLDVSVQNLPDRYVYNNINRRNVILFKSISLEKYFFFTTTGLDHPLSP
jgi:hypothetical protein